MGLTQHVAILASFYLFGLAAPPPAAAQDRSGLVDWDWFATALDSAPVAYMPAGPFAGGWRCDMNAPAAVGASEQRFLTCTGPGGDRVMVGLACDVSRRTRRDAQTTLYLLDAQRAVIFRCGLALRPPR